jgi:hypothetical protein
MTTITIIALVLARIGVTVLPCSMLRCWCQSNVVQPLGLDRIEPRALCGQVTGNQAHALAELRDLPVVLARLAPLYRQGAVVVDHLPFVCVLIVHPAGAAVHELLYTLT